MKVTDLEDKPWLGNFWLSRLLCYCEQVYQNFRNSRIDTRIQEDLLPSISSHLHVIRNFHKWFLIKPLWAIALNMGWGTGGAWSATSPSVSTIFQVNCLLVVGFCLSFYSVTRLDYTLIIATIVLRHPALSTPFSAL